jgi:hypothetical protein
MDRKKHVFQLDHPDHSGSDGNQPDSLESLLHQAGEQYRGLRYRGPASVRAVTDLPSHSRTGVWPAIALVASVVMVLFSIQISTPTVPQSEPLAAPIWQPESRQNSPHAALSAARAVLSERTALVMPPRPPANVFRLPKRPSRASGFADSNEQSS